CDSQCRQHQDETDKQAERKCVANGRQPVCSNRSDQEIGNRENEICSRKSPAESQAIGGGTSEDRQKPNHPTENSSQGPRLLGREIQTTLQVESQGSKSAVIGKPFENLTDIGNPERTLKSSSYFAQAF